MTDLSKTVEPKSDQIGYDDLIVGPRTVKITKVSLCNGEQPISINFDGDNGKPYKPCKTCRRILIHVWGADGKLYEGRMMTLYGDPDVVFGGQKVGGIRISHMSNIDKPVTMSLTASKAKRKPYTVQPLNVRVIDNSISLKTEAENAAKAGTDSLKAFWDGLSNAQKAQIKPIMDDLKKMASAESTEPEITAESVYDGSSD